jgi:hypothetical protein
MHPEKDCPTDTALLEAELGAASSKGGEAMNIFGRVALNAFPIEFEAAAWCAGLVLIKLSRPYCFFC